MRADLGIVDRLDPCVNEVNEVNYVPEVRVPQYAPEVRPPKYAKSRSMREVTQ